MSIESNNDPITENYIDPDDYDVLPDDDSEDEDDNAGAQEAPLMYEMHDTDNARRLIDQFGHTFRYVPQTGSFYVWDFARFRPENDDGKINHLAELAARSMVNELPAIKGKQKRREFKAWMNLSLSSAKRNAAVSIARTSPAVRSDITEFDVDPYLLNTKNGTVNLRDGTFKGHDTNDMITQVANVKYDPKAKCPLFESYLQSSLGDTELIRFLQQAVGYTLSGLQMEKVFIILYGGTDSGKSMFIEIFEALLDEYSYKTPVATLMENYFGTKASSIAQFKGKRFVHTAEGKMNQQFNIGLIKELTGGDTLSGEPKYGHEFKFRPTHTLWFSTNERPEIRGADSAIYGRLRPVKFPKTFLDPVSHPDVPDDLRMDKKLKEKIISNELSGILNWAIQGFLDWQKAGGLFIPVKVQEQIEEYKADMDPLGDLIGEYCTPTTEEQKAEGREATCLTSEFFTAYQTWAQKKGLNYRYDDRQLTKIMKAKGYTQKQVRDGDSRPRAWRGFSLNARGRKELLPTLGNFFTTAVIEED